ncbi:hypothetical protein [Xylophilus sp. GOD-11R]|uniref:hypothetical protein n=1 Tax=Xylophilus sp. GOD-11R TaxID=3089814 RepID=UPI00298CC78F|nr:hypothetical protein [Xylophilus sp. GOD-11R]WPB57299.1 hypothetical protein R9X41_01215 [Xylophilus sp. GOD-11R]
MYNKKDFRINLFLALAIALVGFVMLFSLSSELPKSIYTYRGDNSWFQGDLARNFSNMTDMSGNVWGHHRSRVHPIFSILTLPGTALIRAIAGVGVLKSALIFNAIVGGIWLSVLFLLSLEITKNRIFSVLFCAYGASAAGFVFWFSVPETYPLGSLTILCAVYMVVRAQAGRHFGRLSWVGLVGSTLSITITNFFMGIMAALVSFPRKQALRIVVYALLLVMVISVVQKVIVPSSALFFLPKLGREAEFVNHKDSGALHDRVLNLLVSSVSLPEPMVESRSELLPKLSVQASPFANRTSLSWVGVACWIFLLGCGLLRLIGEDPRLRIYFFLTLGFQLLLHGIYGEETFLYSAHSLPILLGVALFGFRRIPAKYLYVLLSIGVIVNLTSNVSYFHQVAYALSVADVW